MRIATAALLLGISVSALGACAAREEGPPAKTAAAAPAQSKRGAGAMPEVRVTTMGQELAAVGLDPKNLPPIERLDKKQKLRVMKTFSAALGMACFDCHAGGDFAADTRRKRVAKRMFNEIVRLTALENGDPVYCDSCHQGSMIVLDRKDKGKVSDFMSDVYVAKLKRTDNRDHDCGTCHGDPPDFRFITAWKQTAAPDIELASPTTTTAAPAATPVAAPAAPAPTTSTTSTRAVK